MERYYDEYKWFYDQDRPNDEGKCIEWRYGEQKEALSLSDCIGIETLGKNEIKSGIMKTIGGCIIGASVLLSLIFIAISHRQHKKMLEKYLGRVDKLIEAEQAALRPNVAGGHWAGSYEYSGSQIPLNFPDLQFNGERQIVGSGTDPEGPCEIKGRYDFRSFDFTKVSSGGKLVFFKGKIDPGLTTISGYWRSVPYGADEGEFEIAKSKPDQHPPANQLLPPEQPY